VKGAFASTEFTACPYPYAAKKFGCKTWAIITAITKDFYTKSFNRGSAILFTTKVFLLYSTEFICIYHVER